MSTDRDVTRIVRSWLEEGVTALPDRVLDTVLDQLPTTPQRRASWPVRRLREMNIPTRIAVGAAAVLVLAIVGSLAFSRFGGVTVTAPGPSPLPTRTLTPSPTLAPSASSVSNLNFTGRYARGTTYSLDDRCCIAPAGMTFTIPAAGWYAPFEAWRIGKDVPGGSDVFDLYVTPMFVDNVYTGGCHWTGTALVPPVGPTVDDLATALAAQAGPGAVAPTSVTVGGHPGKKVGLMLPSGLDVSRCDSDGSNAIFGRFVSDGGFGAQPYTHGVGQVNTFYIIDVDGTRQVIDAMYLPGTSAADRAELDQIVASIRFGSSRSSPSPAP
jgi:hypothetical protein